MTISSNPGDFEDDYPDDDFEDDEDCGFECAAYWTGKEWHCPLAGSEECDWECTDPPWSDDDD